MSETTTIRVTRQTYDTLKEIAVREHASMQDMVDKLLENYETNKFFEDLQQSVLAVKEDPHAWADELQEREDWEATLSDGLEAEEGDGGADETR